MPDIRPSFLLQLQLEIWNAIAFEHWDHVSKSLVDRIMLSHNLIYEIADYLDNNGKLHITILDTHCRYNIII